MTSAEVTQVDTSGKGVKATIKTKKGEEVIEADIVLSAVGIKTNIENIGLEDVGIAVDRDKILVNDYINNIPGYYTNGDVTQDKRLHMLLQLKVFYVLKRLLECMLMLLIMETFQVVHIVAEIASVGLTEKQAKEKGYDQSGYFHSQLQEKLVQEGLKTVL